MILRIRFSIVVGGKEVNAVSLPANSSEVFFCCCFFSISFFKIQTPDKLFQRGGA